MIPISVERNGVISRYKEKDNRVAFVNPDYVSIFKYEWLLGSAEKSLENPNSVVVSQEVAQKYFGEDNPLGKRLTFNSRLDLQVTGVFAKAPQHTDLPFAMLMAYNHEERKRQLG